MLTDHHYRWEEAELAALRRSTGVPDSFLLLSGQEVSTPDLGHVLVYGRVPSLAPGTSAGAIRERYPDAALVWAHPYRHDLVHDDRRLRNPAVDAIEIFSANHSMIATSRALEDWHRLRFTAVAGTDAHGQVAAGTYPTQFDHPVRDVEELAAEIRGGRCRPLLKEITLVGGNSLVTEVVIGTKGEDGQRPRLILRRISRQEKWPAALATARLAGELAAHGFVTGQFRLPALLEADPERLTIIEEGVRGRPLYERLRSAGPPEGRRYLSLAASWLAHLHNLRLSLTPLPPFLEREQRRLEGYAQRFAEARLPGTTLVRELTAAFAHEEQAIVERTGYAPTQCHGDYHPKNIIVGQDNPEDTDTVFVAAVDFEHAVVAPAAFDVGWFLAHYRHQFSAEPRILDSYPAALFLESYRAAAVGLDSDFDHAVDVFTARAGISIAAYLVKLGLGDGAAVARLLADAARLILPKRG